MIPTTSDGLPGTAVAPATGPGASLDWWAHLLASPAKPWELAQFGAEQWMRIWRRALAGDAADAAPGRYVHQR